MTWTRKTGSGEAERLESEAYEAARAEGLPPIEKEKGGRGFQPVDFQPVRSPGHYEGEFAVKDDDLLFHFWPYGYHLTEKLGNPLPPFKSGFSEKLFAVLEDVFGRGRCDLSHDPDMGAWFARAKGYGVNQFHRELAIRACEKLHFALGGS